MEDRFEKRCDDIYFPFDVKLSGLDSHAEWLQKEVKAIQRQFASQHQISASIDREHSKSIDSKAPESTDKHLVASIDTTSTPDAKQLIQNKMESMHEELNELSAYAYDKIGWHQFSIENTQERLQNISNAIHKMDERWTRNDEATRIGQTSIDKDALTSFDKAPSPSIDRRYECGRRAYDIYGARKFRWEQKDEYGVYRDESGYARSVAEHATSFTPTKLAPEIYTKDEINEMVTGYNELFRSMAEMKTEIESMQHILEKEATTSPSIDANKATSIDVMP
ncbi:hypothetical protein F2Q69_00005257 [Brassica cretica]|uniref:Uncharacterized protein n=1 Tax=Brassica cretica TaxID=69181 RepID=A0A8S9NX93_BRACR|nr:hypothetical protein F2Q69_00005257 [Brassica cretica]